MLAADKLQLQSALKQQATALKEKEFNLHNSNLSFLEIKAIIYIPIYIYIYIIYKNNY